MLLSERADSYECVILPELFCGSEKLFFPPSFFLPFAPLTSHVSFYRDAFSHVQERRFCINPNVGFVHQLQASRLHLHQRVNSKNGVSSSAYWVRESRDISQIQSHVSNTTTCTSYAPVQRILGLNSKELLLVAGERTVNGDFCYLDLIAWAAWSTNKRCLFKSPWRSVPPGSLVGAPVSKLYWLWVSVLLMCFMLQVQFRSGQVSLLAVVCSISLWLFSV